MPLPTNILFLLLLMNSCAILALSRPAIPPSMPIPVPLQLQALNELFPPMPPHCSKAVITPSHPSSLSGTNAKHLRNRLNIGVGQTICFKTDETNANATTELHTLTLSRLEQYHSITQRYRFAIPEVETRCICECSAKTAVCQAEEYSYGRCSGSPSNSLNQACHRTFFSDQPSTGCPSGGAQGEPRLCCELKFRPYMNRTYTALRLESPTTFAVLRYSAFSWDSGRWKEEEKRTISISLDGSTQHQFLDNFKNLELSISSAGKSGNQLNAGMYFVENLGLGSYGELIQQPLNEITDHNFEKLGWFRQDELSKQFFVHNGYIMMDKIHRAKAENCMDQKYQSILDANFYINKESNDSTKFQISESLNQTFRWIKSARVVDSEERHAIVTENEGTNLEIILTTNIIEKQLLFVHNSSKVADFTATIIVDKFSNSVLNITVFNATGILNGYVKKIIDYKSENIDSFTLYIPDSMPVTQQLYARIKPYPVNTIQMVCLRPDDNLPASEVCRPVESIQFDLAKAEIDNRWTDQISKCPECNQISMDGIMKYLNPMSWTSGVSSISDFIMLLTDILVYFSCFIVLYVVISKCIYPIMKCCICPSIPCLPCYSNSKK